MPLLDHFHPPLHPTRHWESSYITWLSMLADVLNQKSPAGCFADEDPAFPDRYEVRAFDADTRPLAAIILVSPANKGDEAHRRAFAAKCAGYLAQGSR